jgi:TolC family type I secretion outer membrane protein
MIHWSPPLLALLLALAGSVHAADPWNTAERIAPDAATPWQPTMPLPAVPAPDAAPAPIARAYSLADLTALALRYNPDTRAAWAAAQAAAADVGIARADYLPTLSADASITQTRSATSGGTPLPTQTRYGPTLSLSYVLLDFGARAARGDVAQASLLAANLEQNQAIQDVVLAVEQAYYLLLGLEALQGAAEQSLKTAQANLAATQQRRDAGLATIGDVYQVETTVAQARLNSQQVQGQVAAARGTLATATGLPVDTALTLQPWPTDAPLTEVGEAVARLLAQAKAQRPELIAAQARVQAANADTRAAAAAGRPTLALSGSMGQTYIADRGDFPRSSIGLTLSVPLFQGFRTTYEVRQARAREAQAQAERDRLYHDVQRQVWEAYYNQQTAATTIASAQALQRSARQAAEVARERYRAGVGTVLEVLSTQTAETEANVQAIQAQLNWYIGVAQLGHAVGALGPMRAAAEAAP